MIEIIVDFFIITMLIGIFGIIYDLINGHDATLSGTLFWLSLLLVLSFSHFL